MFAHFHRARQAPTSALALILECRIKQEAEAGPYIAYCDKLYITDQGASIDEAQRNLQESLRMFLETCIESNNLDSVLKERGVTYFKIELPEYATEIAQNLLNNYTNKLLEMMPTDDLFKSNTLQSTERRRTYLWPWIPKGEAHARPDGH